MSNPLLQISPIDGRYWSITASLSDYFSEFALIKARVYVEIKYLIELTKLNFPQFKAATDTDRKNILEIAQNFSITDAERIKEIERTTNHDVKAVEYYIKEKIDSLKLQYLKEFVHFGLTSQDINNTAQPLLIKQSLEEKIVPQLKELFYSLKKLALELEETVIIARTHGQPASPTTMGKELFVFLERIKVQFEQLIHIPHSAKFGGATGNFNAHYAAFPNFDWVLFADNFVNDVLGLKRSTTTTQIEHYDNFAALCHVFIRINNILIDLCRDIWLYISLEFFKQKIIQGEIGSSAMPHKVNPIDFENAEGNLGLANALLDFFANKLPKSRLQRDLTDSTVLRNVGVPFSHMFIAYKAIIKGINKLMLNTEAIEKDIENNWLVIAEGIQTILRSINYPNPYETLKEFTRNYQKPTIKDFQSFINALAIDNKEKEKLRKLSPLTYKGIIKLDKNISI